MKSYKVFIPSFEIPIGSSFATAAAAAATAATTTATAALLRRHRHLRQNYFRRHRHQHCLFRRHASAISCDQVHNKTQ